MPSETYDKVQSILSYVLVTIYNDQIELREDYHLPKLIKPASTQPYRLASTGTLNMKYNIMTYQVKSSADLDLGELIAGAEEFGDIVTFEGQQTQFISQLMINTNGKTYRYRTDRPNNITRIIKLDSWNI